MNDIWKTGKLTRLIAGLVLLFLALPILIIFPLALNPSEVVKFPPDGFSLRWVVAVLSSPEWLGSIWLSFVIALCSMVIAVTLSMLAALALVRHQFRFKRVVYALILLPMIVPNIIAAVSLFFFFAKLPQVASVVSIVIGHTVIALPVAVIIFCSTLQAIDGQLENAAMSLGASRTVAFLRVSLPLILPAIVTACIFAFLSSFDELLIAMFMLLGGAQTLPVRIWNDVQFQLEPTVVAVSALLVLVSVIAIMAVNIFFGWRRKTRRFKS